MPSGTGVGQNIHLRELGRRRFDLHGYVEAVDGGIITFSDDMVQRLATVESTFA
ncbi:hypothetical protein OHC50_04320 [Paenarthrobacter ilicis]|uniref:hypothetical protein n=1 Tax=Paenarthrobacter ilicis TaxID=43665 RepID=UPI003008F0F5